MARSTKRKLETGEGTNPARGEKARVSPHRDAAPPPPGRGRALSLSRPDALADEVLSIYRQVKAGKMESGEACRRANLLQIANNMKASQVQKIVQELEKRLADAGLLPRRVTYTHE